MSCALPNLSSLRVGGSTPPEPQVVPASVYLETIRDFRQESDAKLRADAETAMFDALGPALGIVLRGRLHESMDVPYIRTPAEVEQMKRFHKAYHDVQRIKNPNPATPIVERPDRDNFARQQGANADVYAIFYDAIYGLSELYRWNRGAACEALYDMHMHYVRYVWNFTFQAPYAHVPISREAEERAWGFLRGVFRPVERRWVSDRLAQARHEYRSSIENPHSPQRAWRVKYFAQTGTPLVEFPADDEEKDENAKYDMLFFTRMGTPLVEFPSTLADDREGTNAVYTLLTAYWSALPGWRWKNLKPKVLLFNRALKAWIMLYNEGRFAPGGRGAAEAEEHFYKVSEVGPKSGDLA